MLLLINMYQSDYQAVWLLILLNAWKTSFIPFEIFFFFYHSLSKSVRLRFQLSINLVEFFVNDVGDDDDDDSNDDSDVDDILNRNLKPSQ